MRGLHRAAMIGAWNAVPVSVARFGYSERNYRTYLPFSLAKYNEHFFGSSFAGISRSL
jgi:hypothetical protein